jgi:hypothetical protein
MTEWDLNVVEISSFERVALIPHPPTHSFNINGNGALKVEFDIYKYIYPHIQFDTQSTVCIEIPT